MVELGQSMFGNKWEEIDAPDYISGDLYDLSEMLGQLNPEEQAHGLLGGEWGYGQEFDNDVFEMHPYWWGDCECPYEAAEAAWDATHSHAPDCYQAELEKREEAERARGDKGYLGIAPALAKEWGLPYEGCAVHCTCTHDDEWNEWSAKNEHEPTCHIVLPNFRHKASGLAVHWYKYIGRSVTVNRKISRVEWRRIFDACVNSVSVLETS